MAKATIILTDDPDGLVHVEIVKRPASTECESAAHEICDQVETFIRDSCVVENFLKVFYGE